MELVYLKMIAMKLKYSIKTYNFKKLNQLK